MKHNKKWKAAIIAICLLSVTALGLGIYAAAANAKAEKYKMQIVKLYWKLCETVQMDIVELCVIFTLNFIRG